MLIRFCHTRVLGYPHARASLQERKQTSSCCNSEGSRHGGKVAPAVIIIASDYRSLEVTHFTDDL